MYPSLSLCEVQILGRDLSDNLVRHSAYHRVSSGPQNPSWGFQRRVTVKQCFTRSQQQAGGVL